MFNLVTQVALRRRQDVQLGEQGLIPGKVLAADAATGQHRGHMLWMLFRMALFLGLGIALGVVHSRAVAEGERIFRETGERARPAVLFAIRLVLVCVAFAVIGKSGPMALGAAIVGFFGVRAMRGRG